MQEAACQRPYPDSRQDDCEKQREHGAETAKQDQEVAEPQDLHSHGSHTRHRQGDAREDQWTSALRRGVDEFVFTVRQSLTGRLKADTTYVFFTGVLRSSFLDSRSVRL